MKKFVWNSAILYRGEFRHGLLPLSPTSGPRAKDKQMPGNSGSIFANAIVNGAFRHFRSPRRDPDVPQINPADRDREIGADTVIISTGRSIVSELFQYLTNKLPVNCLSSIRGGLARLGTTRTLCAHRDHVPMFYATIYVPAVNWSWANQTSAEPSVPSDGRMGDGSRLTASPLGSGKTQSSANTVLSTSKSSWFS